MRKLVLVAVLTLAGCASHRGSNEPSVGDRVTWQGIAQNHKVGAWLAGPGIYVDLEETHWPSDVVDQRVEVSGVIVERHDLPVFIANPDDPPMAGIPVPPGTDLQEASKRYILEDVRWHLLSKEGT